MKEPDLERVAKELDDISPFTLCGARRTNVLGGLLDWHHPVYSDVFARFGKTNRDRWLLVWIHVNQESQITTVLTARDVTPIEMAMLEDQRWD